MSYVILLISSDYFILIIIGSISFLFTGIVLLYLRQNVFDIQQRRQAGDIITDVVSTLNKSIDNKEKRIIDLMMRVDLLELRVQKQSENGLNNYSNVSIRPNIVQSDITSNRRDINLSETELEIIRYLSEQPYLVSEIRSRINKSREHTSRLISRLSKQNLIKKTNVGGQVSCELTNNGRSVLEGL